MRGDRLEQPASTTGMSLQDLGQKLSPILPSVVDGPTPEGRLPEGSVPEQGKEFLNQRL